MEITLRPYQNNFLTNIFPLLERENFVLVQAPTGSGKCLAKGTPVLLYDGLIKPVEELKVGDLLMGPDSQPRTIVSLASGYEEMYSIIPSIGTPYTVNESHILSLRFPNMGERKIESFDGRVFLSGEIVNISVRDYMKCTQTFRDQVRGYHSGPITFPKSEVKLPIEPYSLGVLLAAKNSDLRIDENGRFSEASDSSENKRIPQNYKVSSMEDRLELLAGLIDHKSTRSGTCYALWIKEPSLAEDIAFVGRSLGLKASFTVKKKGDLYQNTIVRISGDTYKIPCRSSKKRVAEPLKKLTHYGYSFKVRSQGMGRYYGFELDGPDHLFLLGDFTVTHNTIIFAEMIKRYMEEYPRMRIAVVAHRLELVSQNKDKLLKVWPEALMKIGVVCASLDKKIDYDKKVLIGSVQTMNRRDFLLPFDLLVIDECHRVPPIEDGGEYHDLIRKHFEINPYLRVMGFTATPFRLNHGYIYGTDCKEGKTNLFPWLNLELTLNQLIKNGYLAPWRAYQPVDDILELKKVKTTAGEYNQKELSELMSQAYHVRSAVDAYQKYGENRQNVLVFAVTIRHAMILEATFLEHGYTAKCVHSNMPFDERTLILSDFEAGKINFLINVGILTEGWDSPRVDCVLMCRPTKSPALFVQMIGRGTRLYENKTDLLILDLVGNFKLHGDPSDPVVVSDKKLKPEKDPYKVCPACLGLIPLASKICPLCLEPLVKNEEKEEIIQAPVMEEVNVKKNKRYEVLGYVLEPYISKKDNLLVRLTVVLKNYYRDVNYYMDFENDQDTFFQRKSRLIWRQLAGFEKSVPESCEEAVRRSGEITLPKFVTVFDDKNGWPRLKEING
jgi:superfamily II DNA or RNA helicase